MNDPLLYEEKQVKYNRDGTIRHFLVVPKSKLFKYPHARFAPFITAIGRRKMYQYLIKNDVYKHVVRTHTDGVLVPNKKEVIDCFNIGDKPGQWKVEPNTYGTYTIENLSMSSLIFKPHIEQVVKPIVVEL